MDNPAGFYWKHILCDNNGNELEIKSGGGSDFTNELYNDKGYFVPYNKNGYTCFDLNMVKRFEDDREYCQLGILCHHWLVDGNAIGYRSGHNSKYCSTVKEIAEVSQRSERAIKGIVAYGKKNGLIVKHSKRFYVNPAHFLKNGQRITPLLFSLFEKDVREVVTPMYIAKLRADAIMLGFMEG